MKEFDHIINTWTRQKYINMIYAKIETISPVYDIPQDLFPHNGMKPHKKCKSHQKRLIIKSDTGLPVVMSNFRHDLGMLLKYD